MEIPMFVVFTIGALWKIDHSEAECTEIVKEVLPL